MVKMKNLYQAFSQIKSEKEFNAFLADLLTVTERRELDARWRIAQMLWNTNRERVISLSGKGTKKQVAQSRIGLSQKDIAKQTGIGLNTISRVSKCLFENKDNGYRRVLESFYGRHASAA